MSWALAANMVLGFASSWQQSYIQKAQYDAQYTINEANARSQNLVNRANADAANLVRAANNSFEAAQASLQNTMRSIGNQTRLESFGSRWNASETNEARILDQMVRGSLSRQLQAASALGAMRAESASRGVGGSSADVMRSVSKIAQGHAGQIEKDNQKYVTYDSLLQKAGLIQAAYNSVDTGTSLASMDYGTAVAQLAQAPINPGDFISPTSSAIYSTLTRNLGDVVSLARTWGSSNTISTLNTNSTTLGTLGSMANFQPTTQYFNMA